MDEACRIFKSRSTGLEQDVIVLPHSIHRGELVLGTCYLN